MRDGQPKAILRRDYQPPPFLVDDVHLDFFLDEHATRVRSRLTLRRNPDADRQADLVLDGQDLKLERVVLDGEERALGDVRIADESLTLPGVPDAFVLELETVCDPAANKSLEGLYVSSGNFCTQCEAEGFRKITYYLDRPDVMAPFTVRVEGDKQRHPVLLSNGNPIARGDVGADRHFVVWQDPFKKPCYLFALVAGTLVRREDRFTTVSGREVDLHVYVEDGNLEKTAWCMESLKQSMAWDEKVFGREYDLDLFQIVAVGDFNMGAMENKGLNIFNTKYVLADDKTATDADFLGVQGVVGHEYFHNWSGNRVTCRDWFQLSLKEGFTVFRDQEFSADMGSRAVKRIEDVQRLRAAQFPEDAGPTAHPVRPDSYVEINNFYTLTVYEKGAEVVRMLHTLLGPDAFRQGTDLYFERHDGQAVTCDDFVSALEDASGQDLAQFRLWYAQAGTPRLTAAYAYDEAAGTLTVTLTQQVPDTPGQTDKQPMHMPIALGLLDRSGADLPLVASGDGVGGEDGDTTRILHLRRAEQSFTFTGLKARPVPSLLRGFSAPVRVKEELDDADLFFRMAHDGDPFVRWDAAQTLALQLMVDVVPLAGGDEDPDVPEAFLAAFATALDDDGADPALLALALDLPKEQVIAEELDEVDPDAVFLARQWLRTLVAATSGERLFERYQASLNPGLYQLTPEAIGRRMLRNLCLGYLVCIEDLDDEDRPTAPLAAEQYEKATNMTDRLAALAQLTHTYGSARDDALSHFYEQHKDDPLVLDKWFAVQALSRRDDVFDHLDALLEHEAFDLENPNKVRALIASFAAHNIVRFHDADGRGYRFLAERIQAIDGFNPQIAARLITPLARFKRYDAARQALMKEQLEHIVGRDGVSKDVYEIATKALAS
jgi:aminopeptidase N